MKSMSVSNFPEHYGTSQADANRNEALTSRRTASLTERSFNNGSQHMSNA